MVSYLLLLFVDCVVMSPRSSCQFEVTEESIATATLHHHLQQQQQVKKTCAKKIN
jgi:hypothetical protein